ncbi:restriction endonuclease subunit S [Cronobacter dublinensis]|nr:restriction endonuclease subunit S [Cronobacter dublinensis]
MAKYKAYPEYKTISSSWLDSIPNGWEPLPLKYLCSSFVKDGPHETPVFLEEGIPFLSVDGIQDNKIVFEGCRYISPSDHFRFSQKCKPVKGDVLLGKSASIGKVALVDTSREFNVWSPLAVITPIRSCLSKFIYYSLQTTMLQAQCEVYSNSNTQKNLGMSTIDNLDFAMPSDQEASTISNFLDHETAKIDSLIEKQQQLIELLKEKRQAVISHAVTKGLNPDVPMKDSGVEWLGEVPVHWDICLLKYKCSAITDGAHISPDTNEGEHYFVSIKDIKKGMIDFNNSLLTSSASYKYLVKTGCKPFNGDILFSKDGTIGQTAIVPDDVNFVVASSLIIIRADKEKASPAFMDLLLQSSLVIEQVESFVKGTALRRLSIQNLEKVFGIFPTLSEQQIISDYVYTQLNRLDVLESKAVVQIQLLEERRTALISAAVTGKIDVRDWKAPDARKTEEPQEATI